MLLSFMVVAVVGLVVVVDFILDTVLDSSARRPTTLAK
jgi:hypothetical protein